MATVTAELKRLLREKDARIISGNLAVKGLLSEVRRQILEELQAVKGNSYTAHHLKQNLVSIERNLTIFEKAARREIGAQLELVWNGGGELLAEATAGSGLYFGYAYIGEQQLQVLKDSSFYRISSLRNAAWEKVRGELTLGILGQKTPQQVASAIAGSLDSPGAFKSLQARAEMITKTELGRAYSMATEQSIRQAAGSDPQLRKEWWHAGHPSKPRINHLRLHGQRQPVDKPFLLGSLILDYPRDPKAPIKETANCGCDLVPWHPAWGKESLPLPNRGMVPPGPPSRQ